MTGEKPARCCPYDHRGWDHPLPLDRIPAQYGGGWSCPGIRPDGSDCGYELAAVLVARPGSPDAILHRILAEARGRVADPLAEDVLALHELLRAGVPFPLAWAVKMTEPRPAEDVPASGLLSLPRPDIIIGESD